MIHTGTSLYNNEIVNCYKGKQYFPSKHLQYFFEIFVDSDKINTFAFSIYA